jgi:hypothetical protein
VVESCMWMEREEEEKGESLVYDGVERAAN